MQPNRLRRKSGLVIAWLITAACLYYVWPMRPRLTLRSDEPLKIIGITPDCRTLVALTLRVRPNNRANNSFDGRDYVEDWSGPIQTWDLRSGKRTSHGIPGQERLGSHLKLGSSRGQMIDSDGWRVIPATRSLHDRSFRFVQVNSTGDRWSVILNLDTGLATRARLSSLPRNPEWYSEEPPTGRWFVDAHLRNDGQATEREDLSVSVIDMESGREVIAVNVRNTGHSRCVSDDERLFAISSDSEPEMTQVWNLESRKLLRTIDKRLHILAFSNDDRLMAGVKFPLEPKDTAEANGEILILDVASGDVKKRLALDELPTFQLAFTQDGDWLLGYDYGDAIFVWNVATGERRDYRAGDYNRYFYPNFGQELLSELKMPTVVGDRERLFDIVTGQTVFTIPRETFPHLITRDSRTVILSKSVEYHGSPFDRLLFRLSRLGIPIPAFRVRPYEERYDLMICEAPSGRIQAILPHRKGHEEIGPGAASGVTEFYNVCALSPDERMLVTASDTDSPNLHVWDFPLRKPLLEPLSWALLAPLLLVLPRLRRHYRGRGEAPQHVTTTA